MEGPIVTVNEGQLQGTILKSVLGSNYFAFKGIPFATPPVGPLRYTEPRPPEKWFGIRDASNYVGTPCLQHRNDMTHAIAGSEDCLYLNIYMKSIGSKKPVMVFIHGGSFMESTANRDVYRQDYLVTQDIVLVYVNYRIGPVGFLSLGHEAVPSNLGLRDILFALQWIQRNIEAFGGDPNNVTIFGSSAGSVICHLFTLIPKAKGLFHKAIMQSGTCFMPRSLFSKYDIKNGFRLASLLGLNSDDPVKVLEYLRTVPGEKLVECEDYLLTDMERDLLDVKPYEPVIDGEYSPDPLIPDTIDKLMKNDADIPIIIGHTTDESLLMFTGRFNNETYRYYNDHMEELMKNKMRDPTRLPDLMRDTREFYLKNKPITKQTEWNLIRLTSDFFIHNNRRIVDCRNKHAKAPTYLFNFSYLGDEPTIYQTDHGPQPLKGVAHADELSYMFYLAYMEMRKKKVDQIYPKEGSKDRVVMERLLRMWYNFAATGNPTPETDPKYITTLWKPSSKDHLYYLDINENLTLCEDYYSESRGFYEKYSKSLYGI